MLEVSDTGYELHLHIIISWSCDLGGHDLMEAHLMASAANNIFVITRLRFASVSNILRMSLVTTWT